jgi:hypothetical protein
VSFGLWGNNGAYPFLGEQREKNQVCDREDVNEKFGKEVIHFFILFKSHQARWAEITVDSARPILIRGAHAVAYLSSPLS